MDYRIERTEACRFVLKKKRFPEGNELNSAQIRALWDQCGEDGTIDSLCRHIDPDHPLGNAVIGLNMDRPGEGSFDYGIGVVSKSDQVEDGLSTEEIPPMTWVVFPCVGKMPEAFQNLWKKIYTEFFPTSEYQPGNGMFLEVYPGNNVDSDDFSCEFWISSEKK